MEAAADLPEWVAWLYGAKVQRVLWFPGDRTVEDALDALEERW